MFNGYFFSLGDFRKISLRHPYTRASVICLAHKYFQLLLEALALGKSSSIFCSGATPSPKRAKNSQLLKLLISQELLPRIITRNDY